MGVVESPDGVAFDLVARTLIGRSPACDVVLGDPSVSGEHAVIAWHTDHWEIRDLGSRNGTRVNGKTVKSGKTMTLEHNSRLELGDGVQLRLVEAAPPVPRATRLSDGHTILADRDLLAFPDPDAPTITLIRHGSGWVLEADEGVQPVTDRQQFVLGAATWQVRLPHMLASTAIGTTSLDTISLGFRVSSDEEHASWFIDGPSGRVDLGDRIHTYLLLTLARARLNEADQPEASRGWCVADDLARRLGITPANLKVYVYRARKQLQDAGVSGAAGLVERRATSNQIRIGVEALTVERL